VLEFAVLSRLTGDERFEVSEARGGSCDSQSAGELSLSHSPEQALAQRAYLAIWNRRSTHNLVGNTIGVTHGHWLAPGLTGVGAGIDSYFEYGIKAAILLGE
jgi:mannosidase alpha-like ER degradation enhancer 1